jgi:hypothetical protein
MMKLLWLSWLFSALFCFTCAAPTARQPTAKVPDEDDFYKPPPGYESAAPGTILRHRPAPNPITLDNKTPLNIKAAWQLQYRTQDSTGKPEATVVTLLVPHHAKPNNLFHYSFFSVRNSIVRAKNKIHTKNCRMQRITGR